MLIIDDINTYGVEYAMCGLKNIKKFSEDKSSELYNDISVNDDAISAEDRIFAMKLISSKSEHKMNFRKAITTYFEMFAPLYFWKSFDASKLGVVKLSESVTQSILKKPFCVSDFSMDFSGEDYAIEITDRMNTLRSRYLEDKSRKNWMAIIETLPSSYMQWATISTNYDILAGMYKRSKSYKIPEWGKFCDILEVSFPYSFLITGKKYTPTELIEKIFTLHDKFKTKESFARYLGFENMVKAEIEIGKAVELVKKYDEETAKKYDLQRVGSNKIQNYIFKSE